ncbi:MAG: TPM domain-containing protein [Acidobacteria bacterium]|nr:TPM domain-containing protein [Acidobacteriota bacterium]
MLRRRGWAVVFALALGLSGAAPSAAQTMELPAATGAVTDQVGVFTPAQRTAIETLAREVEAETGAELAVATVTSLNGTSVEEYATRLFAAWGVGQRGQDNGVLILVAPLAREVRIEVGYGLEGVIPDGLAGQIISEQMIPRFRENDYGGGIEAAATRLAGLVRANHVLTPEERAALDRRDEVPALFWVLFLGAFVATGCYLSGIGLGARAFAPVVFGLIFSGIPLLIAIFVTPPLWAAALVLLAIAATVAGWRLGRRPSVAGSMRTPGTTGWQWGGGGASTTQGSRSSGWSGGSRSSGSSFGGGRSGGGGASGRW